MSGGRRITVVLVDDHEIERRGMACVLNAAPGIEVVGQANTLPTGRHLFRAEDPPDVAMVDAHAYRAADPAVRHDVRQDAPATRWVLLHDEHRRPALTPMPSAGSLAMSKSAQPEEIIAIVRAAHRAEVAPASRRVDFPQLSDPEWRILELLGHGLSNREMAAQLHVAEQTVKNYVSAVLRKLGVDSRAKAAVLVGGTLRLDLTAGAAAVPGSKTRT